MAANIHSLAMELGILKNGESTHLKIGSKCDGRAFRLAILRGDSGAHYRHPLGDYLGMTKPETSEALGHIQTALYAIKDALK